MSFYRRRANTGLTQYYAVLFALVGEYNPRREPLSTEVAWGKAPNAITAGQCDSRYIEAALLAGSPERLC